MLVVRWFAIVFFVSLAVMLSRPRVELHYIEVPAIDYSRLPSFYKGEAGNPPTIIDAAPGITHTQLADTIRLAPGEHIASIDDVQVGSDLSAGMVLTTRQLRSGQFIDVGVSGPSGERRMLVLLH